MQAGRPGRVYDDREYADLSTIVYLFTYCRFVREFSSALIYRRIGINAL